MESIEPGSSESKPSAARAVEYVRMSTEHQQYSTENQREIMRQYAERRGMLIVRTYTDAGKSGLRIDGRDALKQLIHDVENDRADFSAILVYDVNDSSDSQTARALCSNCGEGFAAHGKARHGP